MNNAWETTIDDVEQVLREHKIHLKGAKLEDIVTKLDHASIEKSALYGDDMDDQVEYAYQEITRQLKHLGIVSK